MNYRLPPDVLHYESKWILGLTAIDIMIAGMAILLGIQVVGVVGGLTLGGLALLAVKRYEQLGNRSPLAYVALWAWHRWRAQEVSLPRVLPGGSETLRVAVYDWEGNELMQVEGE